MSRTEQLAKRIREVYLEGYWIANTNYKAQIESLTWYQAQQKVPAINSIAALIFHVNYYLEGLIVAFETGTLTIKDQFSFDMPSLNTASDWDELRMRLLNNANTFALCVAQLDEAKLATHFIDEKYGSYLRNIEGVLEHSYYHLGQIVLINKLIKSGESN